MLAKVDGVGDPAPPNFGSPVDSAVIDLRYPAVAGLDGGAVQQGDGNSAITDRRYPAGAGLDGGPSSTVAVGGGAGLWEGA